MAVIISEFEVLEPPPAPNQNPSSSAPASPPVSPQDVQKIIRHELHREQRVRAH